MEVRLLGPLQVIVSGRTLELRSSMQRSVLAALALRAGQPADADLLVDVLWDGDPPPSAKTSLQAHLSRLRRTLAEHGADQVIRTEPAGYVLHVPRTAVDALVLEARVAEARDALRTGEYDVASALLAEALRLWRGEPLVDLTDSGLIAAERAHLEALHREAVRSHLRARLEAASPQGLEDLAADLEAAVAADPIQESLWALLIRGLRKAGREAEAIHAYERARQVLADELGVDPGLELRRLHADLLRGDADLSRDDVGPWSGSAASRQRHNLPAPLTSFVGRERELDELVHLVSDRRLVTLVGPGGAGKTRLSLEVGGRLLGSVTHGPWFVDLSSVQDAAEVPAAVATVLQIREQSGIPLTQRITQVLRDDDVRLVLDNCEHVLDAAAQLAETLLRTCPGVTILATSREPLGVTGEVIREVAGLELPPADVSGDERHTEAVELLLRRAADVRPSLAGSDVDLASAVAICRRLDGLPLGLEIVATHLRTRTLEEVAGQLNDPFRLSALGSRTAPDRQRTLEGAIRWSCELLTEAERDLLGRLAIFPGSFTRAAADATCGGARPRHAAADPATLLDRLVERSLVAVETTHAEQRFRLLETIRAYARAHLAPPGPDERLGRLHAWLCDLAAEAEAGLRGPDQRAWLDRLDRERDNLHAGLGWADAHGASADVGKLAVPLLWYWTKRGRIVEGERWLARAAARDPEPSLRRLRILNAWSVLHQNVHGPGPELDRILGEAGRLAEELDAPAEKAWNACWTGLAAWSDLRLAHACLSEAATTFAGLGDRWAHALARMYLSFVERVRGDHAAAEENAAAAAATFAELGEGWGGAIAGNTLATLARYRGQLDRARTLHERSLADARALGTLDPHVGSLLGLGVTVELQGDAERALELFSEAVEQARRAGAVSLLAETVAALAWTAAGVGDHRRALACAEEVTRDVRLADYGRCLATTLDVLGRLGAERRPEQAASLHGAASGVRLRVGEDPRPELAHRLDAAYVALRARLGDDGFEAEWRRGFESDPLEALERGVVSARASVSPAGEARHPEGIARRTGTGATA